MQYKNTDTIFYICCSKNKLMHTLLSEIASISTGQTFRQKVTNDPENGRILAIQIKDLSGDFLHINGQPHKVRENQISSGQLLNTGDILFLAKGNVNKAVVYEHDVPAVAASFFFVIRVKDPAVNSHYLAWFMNQRKTQSIIQRQKEGALIGSVKKSVLENLMVSIPPMKTQKLVAKINTLQHQIAEKTTALLRLHNTVLEHQLLQITQK